MVTEGTLKEETQMLDYMKQITLDVGVERVQQKIDQVGKLCQTSLWTEEVLQSNVYLRHLWRTLLYMGAEVTELENSI